MKPFQRVEPAKLSDTESGLEKLADGITCLNKALDGLVQVATYLKSCGWSPADIGEVVNPMLAAVLSSGLSDATAASDALNR